MATASRRRFPALLSRRNGAPPEQAVEGVARLGRRTKDLVKRLAPGDVAVVDHLNIDRIAAEELIAAGVRAVLNAAESSNGRYPNAGPLMLARAGVLLVDVEEGDPFELLREGERLSISGGRSASAASRSCAAACSARSSSSASSTSSASGSTRRLPSSPRTPSPTCAARPTC